MCKSIKIKAVFVILLAFERGQFPLQGSLSAGCAVSPHRFAICEVSPVPRILQESRPSTSINFSMKSFLIFQ
jgi:hypothetical protein